jgi:hypothetical protein
MRTRACELGAFGIVHAYGLLVDGTLAAIVCHAAVGDVLYSIFTLAKFAAVHVMFRTEL